MVKNGDEESKKKYKTMKEKLKKKQQEHDQLKE